MKSEDSTLRTRSPLPPWVEIRSLEDDGYLAADIDQSEPCDVPEERLNTNRDCIESSIWLG